MEGCCRWWWLEDWSAQILEGLGLGLAVTLLRTGFSSLDLVLFHGGLISQPHIQACLSSEKSPLWQREPCLEKEILDCLEKAKSCENYEHIICLYNKKKLIKNWLFLLGKQEKRDRHSGNNRLVVEVRLREITMF